MNRPTVATNHRLYEDRPDCPTRHHNTVGAYRMGCRCPEAREAKRVGDKRRRQRYGPARSCPAVGTARRLQALMALGYTAITIADAIVTDPETIRDVARGERQYVYAATAQAIADLYERWSGTPGTSAITKARALRAGYVPPAAWWGRDIDDPDATADLGGAGDDIVDEVAVQRAIDGDEQAVSALNPAERLEAVRRLVRHGGGTGVVSKQLRLSGTAAAKLVGQVQAEAAA